MDDVPYGFIERVFTKLSHKTIEQVDVRAPLWQEVARVHKEKFQGYRCVFRPSEYDGLLYGFVRLGTIVKVDPMTLEGLAQQDWRYNRVVELWKDWIDIPALTNTRIRHPVGDRLVEILVFVSQFNLERISFFPWSDSRWEDLERRFMKECCEHDMRTENMMIHNSHGHEASQRFLLEK